MCWVEILVVISCLLLLACVIILFLILRRRYVARQGWVFDADLIEHRRNGKIKIIPGIARYTDDSLQWFRTYRTRLTPDVVFPRYSSVAVSIPLEEGANNLGLPNWSVGVRIVSNYPDKEVTREIAVFPESATGLLSWFESAPPVSDQLLIND